MKLLFDNSKKMEELINDGTTISINHNNFIVKVSLPLKKTTQIMGLTKFSFRNDEKDISFYIQEREKISYLSGYKESCAYPNAQNIWSEQQIVLKELMIMHRNMRIEELINEITNLNQTQQ
jgi:hypothetical protein